jgi:predicted nucleic acid-binding Zn ribbon protein
VPSEPDETPVTGSSTDSGGQPQESVDNVADPVKSALANARRMLRGRPGPKRRPHRDQQRDQQRDPSRPGGEGGYSSPHPDGVDPQPLGSVLSRYSEDRGWERPLAEARVLADWAGIVGADVAAHCTPTSLRDGELRIAAQSTAWATQLRLLGATMLARIVAELGPDVVTRLVVTGPVGPSWKHGRLSVPGSRGPRDTYG